MRRLFALLVGLALLLTPACQFPDQIGVAFLVEASSSQPTEPEGTDSFPAPSCPENSVREEIEAYLVTNQVELEGEFPTEHQWADKNDLDRWRESVSSLRWDTLTQFTVCSLPNDHDLKKPLTPEQVESILETLCAVEPACFDAPENPATGGSLSFYLTAGDSTTVITYNGNWLTLSLEGDGHYYIFSSKPCDQELGGVMALVDELLAEEDPLRQKPLSDGPGEGAPEGPKQ